MSALQALRDRKSEQKKQAEAERWEAIKLKVEAFREKIVAEFGDVLAELSPVFGYDGGYPVVTLTYRGNPRQFGDRGCYPLTENNLIEWAANVDEAIEKYEQEKADARKSVLTYWLPNGYLDNSEGIVRRYSLGDDPEIATALKVAQDEAAAQEEERERQEAERQAAQKADLISQIKNASDLEALHAILYSHEYDRNRYDDDIIDAENEAQARLTAEKEERDKKLAQAQAAEFKPFRWYRVVYALVASDDGQMFVETDSFPCLTRKPTGDGWRVPANGGVPVEVAHLVKVERHDVLGVDDMPDWCHREYIKDLGYIRTVPVGAELL